MYEVETYDDEFGWAAISATSDLNLAKEMAREEVKRVLASARVIDAVTCLVLYQISVDIHEVNHNTVIVTV